jgi:ParB family chromosome partitioning protein
MKRKALGRGLSALIPDPPPPPANDASTTASGRDAGSPAARDYFLCPIEQIRPSGSQPRRFFDEETLRELVASIREHGLVQPLVVRPGRPRGSYVLIAGERRWRAAQKAGIHQVPVVIREVSAGDAFELALVENIQREDLNPIEEAEAFQRLIEERSYSQEKLAGRVGKDRSTIANSLRLLKLPDRARRALVAGTITTGHARALLGLEQANAMGKALRRVIQRALSVRQTEALVKTLRDGTPTSPEPAAASANVRDLEHRLTRSLKTRVKLSQRGNDRGRIEIHYGSLDELGRLLEILLR